MLSVPSPLSLATTTNAASVAHQLTELSLMLRPIMERAGLALSFSALSSPHEVVVDATQNPTSAYKIRGALAALSIARRQGAHSVWTASAGNHGAGVAYAAKLLGMTATIYVPENAPQVKVAKIEHFGATVIRTGSSFDECLAYAKADQKGRPDTPRFVHPFDDLAVAAGQGTIGLELLEHAALRCAQQNFSSVRIFLPIGGGGLAAGVASAVKTLWPACLPPPQVVGVIDEGSPASMLGMSFGRPIHAVPDTIADGTKVARVGETFLDVAHLVDTVMLVPHDALVDTMHRFYQVTGRMIEPSGALALTAERLSRYHDLFRDGGKALSLPIVSGTNVDPDTFTDTVSRPTRVNSESHVRSAYDVRIPEEAGQLLHFLRTVAPFNITSLTYKQTVGRDLGSLRVEFELEHHQHTQLRAALDADFPGSCELSNGEHMLFSNVSPIASEYRDDVITLDDTPGSFRAHIEQIRAAGNLGSVGFLYYRKPSRPGSLSQVVLGRR